jgi:hypothetical protein
LEIVAIRWAELIMSAAALALLFGRAGTSLSANTSQNAGVGTSVACQSAFPATGQTTPYTADTSGGYDTVLRDDGTVRAGRPLNFRDNGDGTLADLNTQLVWEKKSADGGLHDWQNTYYWSLAFRTTIWDWLDKVNSENETGFAGYNDWRIPNVKELLSIVDFQTFNPAVAPILNNGLRPGCTVRTCSLTAPGFYWSSTALASIVDGAWGVFFANGIATFNDKSEVNHVRAVRGGCVSSPAPRDGFVK